MNAVREWLEAVRPPASRSRLAEALTGRRDVLATSDPVENTRMGLPAEPSRYGASLTNRQPDTVDGVRPMFGLPQQAPVVNPREEARTRMMADALMGASGTIRAFHGSPHRFDRFAMSRIGTGEGAQAYGHGLYFAGNEGVARGYRDALAPFRASDIQDVRAAISQREAALARAVEEQSQIAAQVQAGRLLPRALQNIESDVARLRADLSIQQGRLAQMDGNTGHMYEVRLNTTPERLLDWDAPLSQQAPETQRALMNLPNAHRFQPEWSGAQLHESTALIPGANRNNVAASQALREAGIDGIQYLDAGSRSAGQGSRNYVMFNDAQIEILRRYGLLGPTVGLGTAAATSGEQ